MIQHLFGPSNHELDDLIAGKIDNSADSKHFDPIINHSDSKHFDPIDNPEFKNLKPIDYQDLLSGMGFPFNKADYSDPTADSQFVNNSGSYDIISKQDPIKGSELWLLRRAPAMETISLDEQAEHLSEYLVSDQSTEDVVNDMIVNTYAHIRAEDYDSARKQLGILRAVDLYDAFHGDEALVGRVNDAISELEGKVR